MIIQIQNTHETKKTNRLIFGKKYIVYAYEEDLDGNVYWIYTNEDWWLLSEDEIKVLDNTHSKYWVKITSTRTNSIMYYPQAWVKDIPEKFYNDRIDEIEWFWAARLENVDHDCHTINARDCEYIQEINDEYPEFFFECNMDNLAYTAKQIQDNWVFCTSEYCKDNLEAFEVDPKHCIEICPKCKTRMYNPIYKNSENNIHN